MTQPIRAPQALYRLDTLSTSIARSSIPARFKTLDVLGVAVVDELAVRLVADEVESVLDA